jgi:hypothetical protein
MTAFRPLVKQARCPPAPGPATLAPGNRPPRRWPRGQPLLKLYEQGIERYTHLEEGRRGRNPARPPG